MSYLLRTKLLIACLLQPNYGELKRVSNLVRNFDDINDSWQSILSVINFYGDNDMHFAELAGPGYFNDPDEVGYVWNNLLYFSKLQKFCH